MNTSFTETPNYYAIIPANVRYDRDLMPNAKLLYGEITSLCNEKGFCWAENSYFAELYKVSETSISKWISQLVKKKYLSSTIEYREGTKQILHRYLRIVNDPIEEKLNTPIEEKLKENIKDTNNKMNKENILKEIFDFWNSMKIIQHKELTEGIKTSISKALKLYGVDKLKIYIERYSRVIKDNRYFFDYKWSLKDLLDRKGGISSFADDGSKWVDYCNKVGLSPSYQQKEKQVKVDNNGVFSI